MEDEVDLRPYIETLIQHWRQIVGIVILTVAFVFLFTRLFEPPYKAKSSIAIVRSRTNVSFGSRIQTLSEGEFDLFDSVANSRRDALIGLAQSNAVAVQALAEVSGLLLEDEQNISSLLEFVEIENDGDLIHILVQYRDAEIAAQIANTWAQSFEQTANKLYSASDDTNLSLITDQVKTSEAAYEASQQNMEAFINNNEIASLQREINTINEILGAYQQARNNIQSGSITLQIDNQQAILATYYNDLKRVDLWLIDAETLHEQVRIGQNSDAEKLANTLTFISLQRDVFGGGVPVELQINFNEPGEGIDLEEVDTLINVLKFRHETTNEQIEQINSNLSTSDLNNLNLADEHPFNLKIRELNESLLILEAQQEAEAAQKRGLMQSRDLAWETFQTLLRKQTEVEIAVQTLGSEVRLASPAVPPEEPISNQTILKLVVAAVFSFGLMVTVIFAWEWWQTESNENSSSAES
ncbi:MAG: hypothetical protein GY796_24370 [Chloroflexi bacterium]|nr:hypothetical protein [Chloroflexota bacterium]